MLLFINGGTFQMGSSTGMADERPVHSVTLSNFLMDNYQTTQESWQEVMGTNPSYFAINPAPLEIQLRRPVERISQYDAFVYCNRRSVKEGFTPCYVIKGTDNCQDWGDVPLSADPEWNNVYCRWDADGYRLPTEAEWEYAARSGQTANAPHRSTDEEAWNKDNSGMITHGVGLKKPNQFGLYDMFGNVWEWCWDSYTSYTEDACSDPHEQAVSDISIDRIGRGGAWNAEPSDCTPFFRNGGSPAARYSFIGMRVVRSISG
ncbi:MAG: formylglycine-generating enzyme family protein [Treponema sp.]|nr:formylglycine-generating enzyme family protein [Treponema sp.]